eukprot:jgi/Chlat1/4931/Chrsp31S08932
MARLAIAAVLLLALCSSAAAKVYYEEKFNDADWEKRWLKSDWKKDEGTDGDWLWTAGKWYGDEDDKGMAGHGWAKVNGKLASEILTCPSFLVSGIQTNPDARFYAITSELDEVFSNEGKDLVKHEQKLDCGGGYIKLMPSGNDMSKFSGATPYSIMFGPDVCGYSTKRVHVIFTYKGKNLLTKKDIKCETDQLSHVYTLVVKPDNTYKVLIDNEVKAEGSLYEDWDFLAPKQIKDPKAKKPEDWDERPKIPDPEDKKPEGYDDIPKKIVDPEAQKPEDWDEEDDGEWEPPMIDNPEYKGPWKPKMVDNPDYKGKWEAPLIDNPEFEDDPNIYQYTDIKHVGFELWQVTAGTIFDNILLTDDEDYAKKFAEDTWGALKKNEKEMFEEHKKEEDAKAEEERKAMEKDLEENGGDAEMDGEEEDDYAPPEDEEEDEFEKDEL